MTCPELLQAAVAEILVHTAWISWARAFKRRAEVSGQVVSQCLLSGRSCVESQTELKA